MPSSTAVSDWKYSEYHILKTYTYAMYYLIEHMHIPCFIAIFLANAGLSPPILDATAMTNFLQVGGACF